MCENRYTFYPFTTMDNSNSRSSNVKNGKIDYYSSKKSRENLKYYSSVFEAVVSLTLTPRDDTIITPSAIKLLLEGVVRNISEGMGDIIKKYDFLSYSRKIGMTKEHFKYTLLLIGFMDICGHNIYIGNENDEVLFPLHIPYFTASRPTMFFRLTHKGVLFMKKVISVDGMTEFSEKVLGQILENK